MRPAKKTLSSILLILLASLAWTNMTFAQGLPRVAAQPQSAPDAQQHSSALDPMKFLAELVADPQIGNAKHGGENAVEASRLQLIFATQNFELGALQHVYRSAIAMDQDIVHNGHAGRRIPGDGDVAQLEGIRMQHLDTIADVVGLPLIIEVNQRVIASHERQPARIFRHRHQC